MTITEQKKGSKVTYTCRFWYYKNGIKKSKSKSGFLKKKDAERWGIDEKRKLERVHVDSDKMLLGEFLERWIATKEGKLSPTTISGYKVNIGHIKRYLGKVPIANIETIDIQEMADDLSDEGKKKRTVSYVIRTLHVALQYAIKNKYITSNPCTDIAIADDKEEFEASILSVDDVGTLLSLLKEQEHYLYIPVLLAVMRGLRRGECLGLEWDDIDEKNNALYVKNNYVRVDGVDYHKKVKTKTSKRIVSIEGTLLNELIEHKERLYKNGIISKYVCVMPNGQLPVPSHISRGLRQFQEANNLPVCRFHDLRHTFAMLQLECGTDLDTLSRLLGHSKISVTSGYYLQQNITMIKKASATYDNMVLFKNKKCHNNVTLSSEAK